MPVGTRARAATIPEVGELPRRRRPRYATGRERLERRARVALTIADEGVRIAPSILDEERARASTPPRARRSSAAPISPRSAPRSRHGCRRLLLALARSLGRAELARAFALLHDYGARMMGATLRELPDGVYPFADSLDDDGAGTNDVSLRVVLTLEDGRAIVDLSESDDEPAGSLNAVRAVTEAAVSYAFRLLLPAGAPTSEGLHAPVEILTRPGSICDAQSPRAVAAGNVETSQRIVDLVLGALARACSDRIPAASAGSMSNLLLGDDSSAYYETIAGGAGAGPARGGASGVQTHMTNTRNTPIEILEASVPVRVHTYALRRESGGGGTHRGGDGIVRELEFLAPTSGDARSASAAGGRRTASRGGGPGSRRRRHAHARGRRKKRLPGEARASTREPGDRLRIETPGGGGFGDARRGKFWAAISVGRAAHPRRSRRVEPKTSPNAPSRAMAAWRAP